MWILSHILGLMITALTVLLYKKYESSLLLMIGLAMLIAIFLLMSIWAIMDIKRMKSLSHKEKQSLISSILVWPIYGAVEYFFFLKPTLKK